MKRTVLWIAAWLLSAAVFAQDTSIVPADRRTVWNPGATIATRTTVCATVNASTYGNGSSDATAGIQAAINACPAGQVVSLSAGTFKISSAPLFLNKGITLRGAGPSSTILNEPDGGGQPVIVMGPQQWPSEAASTNLTANAVRGAYSVTVASTSGLSVGQIVLIDKTTDSSITHWADDCTNASGCRGWFARNDRSVSQMMEIASISGSTITFTTPFHIDFETTYTAQLSRYGDAALKNAGLEDMKIQGGEGGDSGGNVYMTLAAYSWVKNIESYNSNGGSIHLYRSFRNTVRDSYFHETKNASPGGSGYGLDISRSSSDNLVENNIFWKFNKVMTMRASGGGNVIAYNYFEDGYISYALGWVETGANASHMTTPHFELFEGNQAFNIGSDARWGNSYAIIFFRNHSTCIRRNIGSFGLTDSGNRVCAEAKAYHYKYAFIGNVLGYSGQSPSPQGSSFTYEDTSPYSDNPVPMFRFGMGEGTGTSGVDDPTVAASTFRAGNFDYASNSVHWESISATTLPNSLYLASKPSFFGSCTWPWVDAVGTTKLYTLPARARFDGNTTACSGSSVPTAPANFRTALASLLDRWADGLLAAHSEGRSWH